MRLETWDKDVTWLLLASESAMQIELSLGLGRNPGILLHQEVKPLHRLLRQGPLRKDGELYLEDVGSRKLWRTQRRDSGSQIHAGLGNSRTVDEGFPTRAKHLLRKRPPIVNLFAGSIYRFKCNIGVRLVQVPKKPVARRQRPPCREEWASQRIHHGIGQRRIRAPPD